MDYDIIVIGAGPAGMTSAMTAAKFGAKVLLLDDQPAPGGQVYRAVESADERTDDILGIEYAAGRRLTQALRSQHLIEYVPHANVWQVTDGHEVGFSSGGSARLLRAPWIILATGAIERPFPIPGWTLPGVMMAGGAQALLKVSGLVADAPVFAGSGPLLYLVAYQYLKAGAKVAALLDTSIKSSRLKALPHVGGALSRWDMLSKGRSWMAKIRKSGTQIANNVTELRIHGKSAVNGISYQTQKGLSQEIKTENIFLHQGVVPNVNLAMAAGIEHFWHSAQLCWHPKIDAWGRTNVDGLVVAGDGMGIGGAEAAQATGQLAALGCLAELGKIDVADCENQAKSVSAALVREKSIRPFLDYWFQPALHFRVPSDETIVCRCEELTAQDIRDVIDMGIAGPNQLKSYCRAGMGLCQGRYCGLTVQEIIGQETGREPEDIGYYRLRPPIKPIPLDELAEMEADPPANEN